MSIDYKIVGVGRAKTGTTTLGKCFNILGYKTLGENDALVWEDYKKNKFDRIMKSVDENEAFFDIPWKLMYQEIDKKYPNSKFIMTKRKDLLEHAISSWFNSTSRMPNEEYIVFRMKEIVDQEREIMEYFKGRENDFCVLCFEDGDGWKELCEFLDVPIIDKPFPWEYKNNSYDKSVIDKFRYLVGN